MCNCGVPSFDTGGGYCLRCGGAIRHEPKGGSGFEPIPGGWLREKCRHPEHEPPGMICIPQGQQYRHVCPGCGATTIMRPPQISMRASVR